MLRRYEVVEAVDVVEVRMALVLEAEVVVGAADVYEVEVCALVVSVVEDVSEVDSVEVEAGVV